MKYSTDDMRNYAGDLDKVDFSIGGTRLAMREAADEIDRLELCLRQQDGMAGRYKSQVATLRDALSDLCRAYVSLMESGRDRIVSLGGDCDTMEKMETGDPYLIAAKSALQPFI